MANPTTHPGGGDMFLLVTGTRGNFEGEAQDEKHKGEIEVLSWTWGLQGKQSLQGGGASGATTARELRIVKRLDSASTALLAAMRQNETIKEAVLTLRKGGKTSLEYLKIKIEDARVVSLEIEGGDEQATPIVMEKVGFNFRKIDVQYTPQGPDGRPGSKRNYSDEWGGQM